MRETFRRIFFEKCKDFGLTDKAIDELCKLGCNGLADDATESDINEKVDSLVPFARAMQGEITRKAQKQQPVKVEPQNEIPDWFKAYKDENDKRFKQLQKENDDLKAQGVRRAREEKIAHKAKELGIPDFLMKRMIIADDADYEKELTEYKQELVNAGLPYKDETGGKSDSDEQIRNDADSWADSLPDK